MCHYLSKVFLVVNYIRLWSISKQLTCLSKTGIANIALVFVTGESSSQNIGSKMSSLVY